MANSDWTGTGSDHAGPVDADNPRSVLVPPCVKVSASSRQSKAADAKLDAVHGSRTLRAVCRHDPELTAAWMPAGTCIADCEHVCL